VASRAHALNFENDRRRKETHIQEKVELECAEKFCLVHALGRGGDVTAILITMGGGGRALWGRKIPDWRPSRRHITKPGEKTETRKTHISEKGKENFKPTIMLPTAGGKTNRATMWQDEYDTGPRRGSSAAGGDQPSAFREKRW